MDISRIIFLVAIGNASGALRHAASPVASPHGHQAAPFSSYFLLSLHSHFSAFLHYIHHTRPDPITKRISTVPHYKWRPRALGSPSSPLLPFRIIRVTKSLNARFLLEKNLVCQTRTATETTRAFVDMHHEGCLLQRPSFFTSFSAKPCGLRPGISGCTPTTHCRRL